MTSSTLGARGFFSPSEAAIVSSKDAIVILPREKNPLDTAVTNLTSVRTCFNLSRLLVFVLSAKSFRMMMI